MTDSRNPPERRPRYQWPDATPGNLIALKHGAYSDRMVEPRAQALLDEVVESATWWTPADAPAARAWAVAEARCQLVSEYLAQVGGDAGGMVDGEGAVRPAATHLLRLEARAESLRSKLGLDPLSRARLGRDTAAGAVDLAALFARLASEGAADSPGSGPVVPVDGLDGGEVS